MSAELSGGILCRRPSNEYTRNYLDPDTSMCIFLWGETHVGRAFLLDLPAFPGFQVDYVDIMKLACGPHALCAVRSCGGEKRPYGIPLIGCLQSRKFFCCQLEKASGTEVVDGCIRSFQIGRFVKGLLRVLYLFIPAPYLYIRAILSQKGRVFLFGLRSSSEEKTACVFGKYKGAFSLIIHEAGNALSPRSAISLPGVLFSARYRLLRVAAESLWGQNR